MYAAKRKDTEKYAAKLARNGLRAEAYHAGRTPAERELVHEKFLDGRLDVVVATTAFGMGIDKPDVRFVLHADIPESLDSYYQQIGRAGRDGQPAVAVLHYRSEDLGLRRFFATHTPDEAALLAVLTVLREAGRPLQPQSLADWTAFPARRITGLLNQLQETGAVTTNHDGVRLEVALDPTADPARVVERAVELAAARERVDKSRIAMIRSYAETHRCRRQFLLGYFGEDLPEPCGNCDTCTTGTALLQGHNGEHDGGAAARRRCAHSRCRGVPAELPRGACALGPGRGDGARRRPHHRAVRPRGLPDAVPHSSPGPRAAQAQYTTRKLLNSPAAAETDSWTFSTRPGASGERNQRRNSSTTDCGPSATMPTVPSSLFLTVPVSPSSSAFLTVQYRKPTAWTTPDTLAFSRTGSPVSAENCAECLSVMLPM